MDFTPANLSVYVATDGVIYKDEVHDAATGKKSRRDFGNLESLEDKKEREEAKHLYDASTPQSSVVKSDTFKPVLILVALRLGIDSLHPTYYKGLKSCFETPSFIGIAGGRPNSSLYFVGLQGDELIYLDPHYSRPALETKSLFQYTKKDFNTYHCIIPRKIHISNIDPSMLIGFYCRNTREFDLLCQQITKVHIVFDFLIFIKYFWLNESHQKSAALLFQSNKEYQTIMMMYVVKMILVS